jgi:hypothetical protein
MKFTSEPNWVPLEVDEPVPFDAAAPDAPPEVVDNAIRLASRLGLGFSLSMGAPIKNDSLAVAGSSAETVSKPVTPHKSFNCRLLLLGKEKGPHNSCLTSPLSLASTTLPTKLMVGLYPMSGTVPFVLPSLVIGPDKVNLSAEPFPSGESFELS